MDLTKYGLTDSQRELAKQQILSGLFFYQPFKLANDLEVGVGMDFNGEQEGLGTTWCPEMETLTEQHHYLRKALVKPEDLEKFRMSNQRLDQTYINFVDFVCDNLPGHKDMTVAEIGSCQGYFPLAFAERGVKRAVGYDRENYSKTVELLNDITGQNTEFKLSEYNPYKKELPGEEEFDLVMSIATLVHLSDPLDHLALLGRMAKKALFVWTTAEKNEDMMIRYRSFNRYYKDAQFPYCFDLNTMTSGLVKNSLKLMGFNEIREIDHVSGLSEDWFGKHVGLLAIRSD
jgi:hypothetical protein